MVDVAKEIGGYMELDEYSGTEYHKFAIALNSGRHCLEYLIRVRNIKKIFLPYFLCASVKKICEKCNVTYEYYHIDENFNPRITKNVGTHEYVYIVNYYGQKNKTDIASFKNMFKNIIIDNSQAFFDKPVDEVDTLYTCRKFFGVSDGGYLYTDVLINENLETDISYDRIEYVLGRFEKDASSFYKMASYNNKIFESEDLKIMSKLTHNLLKAIDYEKAKQKRTDNFEFLHSALASKNKLDIKPVEGAFMYPFYAKGGMDIKKILSEQKIYIPTLWPDVLDICQKDSLEYDYAENILPLPVDQRYGQKEMKKLAEAVLLCIS